jgi:hypothetical protein
MSDSQLSPRPYTIEWVPRKPCSADAAEPDDTSATAASGGGSRTLCSVGDEDWVRVPLVAGQRVKASATFLHADGDVDLRLYDRQGRVRASSLTYTDDERLVYEASADGDVFVQVTLVGDGAMPGVTYELDVQAP